MRDKNNLEPCDYITSVSNTLNQVNTNKQFKVLEIIKKYTYSGGWSDDYTTEYWKMKEEEIELIDEFFSGVPIKPLLKRD